MVFPVFDALESFSTPIPIVDSLVNLVSRVGAQQLYTLFFPGESARILWNASKLESPDVFFEHSFSALQREDLQFETTTPSRFLKGCRGFSRAYFPGCGSNLLMERSMPANPPKTKDSFSLFTGSPRRLLLRHTESLALYAKMHYVRILVGQLRGDKSRKKTAQEELWKGQCGGAYWKGPEGGIARLSIRAAAYSALIESEKITRQRGSFSPGIISADMDFDGVKEIIYQGVDLNAYVQLNGACLSELDSFRTRTNYVNVMDGQTEGLRRLCFRDRFSEKGTFSIEKGGFTDDRYVHIEAERPASVATLFCEGKVELGGKKRALEVRKTYTFRKGGLSVDYEISNKEPASLRMRLGVEFNLAAGFSPDLVALVGIRGREDLTVDTSRKCIISDISGLRLSNQTKNEKIEIRSDLPFTLSHLPIQTEASIGTLPDSYQGCALTLGWDLEIPVNSARMLSITLEMRI